MGMYGPPPRRPRGSVFLRIFVVVLIVLLLGSLALNGMLAAVMGITRFQHGKLTEATYVEGDTSRRIVIIPISGVIDDATATFIHDALVKLDQDRPAAIVLRVDSPGGGVSASDRIAHELRDFRDRAKIPVVASYGSLAASGRYYVSAMADYIMVEPTTITGSIGVIAEAFTIDKLLEKIGVTPENVTSRAAIHKNDLSPFHAWTDADRGELRDILDQAHARFVDTVFQGRKSRNLTLEQVKTLATGQIFTAKEAIDVKLADEEGYLEEAIKKAAELAKIEATTVPQVNRMEKPKTFFGIDAAADVPDRQALSLSTQEVRRILGEMTTMRLEYRMLP